MITEYAHNSATGTFGAGTTFASGLNQPLDLKTDALGDLFVENYNVGAITKFTFNSTTGVFGPSDSAPVPEASQAVSLGLLLALGMGGVAVARKKRRKA